MPSCNGSIVCTFLKKPLIQTPSHSTLHFLGSTAIHQPSVKSIGCQTIVKKIEGQVRQRFLQVQMILDSCPVIMTYPSHVMAPTRHLYHLNALWCYVYVFVFTPLVTPTISLLSNSTRLSYQPPKNLKYIARGRTFLFATLNPSHTTNQAITFSVDLRGLRWIFFKTMNLEACFQILTQISKGGWILV